MGMSCGDELCFCGVCVRVHAVTVGACVSKLTVYLGAQIA